MANDRHGKPDPKALVELAFNEVKEASALLRKANQRYAQALAEANIKKRCPMCGTFVDVEDHFSEVNSDGG